MTLGVPNSVSKALLSTLDQPPAAGSQLRSASIAHIYPLYLLKEAAETLKTGSHSSSVHSGVGEWILAFFDLPAPPDSARQSLPIDQQAGT